MTSSNGRSSTKVMRVLYVLGVGGLRAVLVRMYLIGRIVQVGHSHTVDSTVGKCIGIRIYDNVALNNPTLGHFTLWVIKHTQ